MAENVLKLKKKAVALGMTKDKALRADRDELEKFITEAESGKNKPAKKKSKDADENKPAKKAKKKGKKAGRPKKDADEPEKPAKRKPGRPKGSGKKVKVEKTPRKGKKPGGQKRTKTESENTNNGQGRLAIGQLDWNATSDDWNPRVGGPVERLFKALKKSKGDIDKAFDLLADDVYDFVGKKKRDGTKRTKDEAYAMLAYRLNRTKFEFARRTGQHKSASSKNRAEYGTGAYASTRKKRGTSKKKS